MRFFSLKLFSYFKNCRSEAKNLTAPSGFCFCWGGVKANCGVTRGKVMYEVRILEHLAADFGENHIETSPHLLRIGWSMVHASLQLGEEQDSWGYGGTGKFSTNNKFSDYGEAYTIGDVITAFLDLDSKPASISFAKNGLWLGVASPLHGFKVDQKSHAMFPHILSKNCRFEVNFGQQSSWCPVQYVNHDHVFINNISPMYTAPGPKPPQSKSDCEVIMVVGLPGSGKTTWARKMFRDHPEKMYNIIGTDDLIDKMKVMGLPRKNNYSGRWEVLIQQATSCLNKIFFIASRKLRHYIIDQTNVYATARKRKMKNFVGFKRICAVLQPEDDELKRREWKRTFEEGKVVPEEAVMEMKMNYSLPDAEVDEHIDEVIWIELGKDASCQLVNQYNEEGSLKLPSRKRLSSTSLPNNSNNSSNNNSSSNNNVRTKIYYMHLSSCHFL
ncbi:hypothetical protein HELRODRAFT_64249 [Helobdella robusta]|uniref:B30.2/SPRY domain-containing protein n=1 Tax=Helobdella robusta TaxID=6412 RepID=T1FXR7_HELRO|nr:hypothetical protein HELRODRAFT_64249 [Helobdella robusta]ESO06326.1 hypothetical protein HELRODRAFT_64249 [Helobdella robusta]